MMIEIHQSYFLFLSFGLGLLLFGIRFLYTRFTATEKWASKSIGWRPIPQPRSIPIVKNLLQVNLKEPLTSVNELAKNYRDCFRMDLPGVSLVIINSQRLYDEVCNTKRFHKEPTGALYEARNGGGDALFTAFTHEENYGIAHRVLTPLYGQSAVTEVLDDMYEMTCILVDKWSKLGPSDTFNPYDEFSKFALDTIAQCGFDLHLNSMRRGEVHHFAHAMTFFLAESGKRALRPKFVNKYILFNRNRRYWEAIDEIQALAKEAMIKRKMSGKKRKDILEAMMYSPDPMTGKVMTEESCMYNTLSLLGAGYESVASMLSWTLILLVKHPHCLQKLRHELEEKLGECRITKGNIDDLSYLTACIREAVRLYPGAYAHNVKLREEAIAEDSTGLGKEQYLVKRSDTIRLNLLAIHRDPLVYGADAEEFKPERMMEENFRKLPRNSWKPFGNGGRICIGRFFALQEAYVVLPTLLQKFDFKLVDDHYRCHIGETLILQPVQCAMQVTRRE